MEGATRTTSRRSVLGRGLALVAGAVGLGASGAAAASAAATPKLEGTELVLHGRNFHLHSQEKVAGQLPQSGDRHSAYGELLDRARGKVIGHFTAAHLTHA